MKIALTILIALFAHHAFAQCGASLPYDQWQPAGATGNNAVWQNSGFTTLQTANPDPSFLIHPDSVLNVRLTGTITVTSGADDDFIGFAIFTAGGMWLFDWKQNSQSSSGYFANEGFAVMFITGAIDYDNNSDFSPVLWGHSDPRIAQIGTNYGSTLGWNTNQPYNLAIIYTENRIMIEVDGQVVLDQCRLNEPGLFAWYNFSQPRVEYTNFTCSAVPVTVSTDIDTTICAGSPYFAGGQLRDSSGTYVDTFAASSGCDSTVTTYLTVTSCNDFNACTIDACSGGGCSYSPVVCDDLDACTTDTCFAVGGCSYSPVVCDDLNTCTTDACSGGICSYSQIICDDLNVCTTDACSGGVCNYSPVVCDDLDACTIDTCSVGGCNYSQIICDDLNACTADICFGGVCNYSPAACDDLNACTTDTCNGVQCIFTAIICNDADPCTADSCVNGACIFTPIICDDSEVCTVDECDLGSCSFTRILIEAFISPPQDTIKIGDTLLFSAGSVLTDPVYRWWPSENLSCDNCESPIALPLVSTGYSLVVTDASGCTDTARALITVEEYSCPQPFIPNVFTPNGDGMNDVFRVYGNINNMHMQIFNRWGESMFESFSLTQGWDGTYLGKPVSPDVFIYVVEFCDDEIRKGSVTLLK